MRWATPVLTTLTGVSTTHASTTRVLLCVKHSLRTTPNAPVKRRNGKRRTNPSHRILPGCRAEPTHRSTLKQPSRRCRQLLESPAPTGPGDLLCTAPVRPPRRSAAAVCPPATRRGAAAYRQWPEFQRMWGSWGRSTQWGCPHLRRCAETHPAVPNPAAAPGS